MSIELIAIVIGFLATIVKALIDARKVHEQVAQVYAMVSNHIPTELGEIRRKIDGLPCVAPKNCTK